MPYYKKNTLFKTKKNRLHIFQRKDVKTNNWYFILLKAIQNNDNFQNKLGFWKSSILI